MKIYNSEQNHSQFKSESEWTLFAFYYGLFLSLKEQENILLLNQVGNKFCQEDIFKTFYIGAVDSQNSRYRNRSIAEKRLPAGLRG